MIKGHNEQQELIKRLLLQKNFPNSLILSGPQGIGKSIIAKNICLALQKKITINDITNKYNLIDLNENIFLVKKIYLDDKKKYKQKVYREDINYINDFFSTKNDSDKKKYV